MFSILSWNILQGGGSRVNLILQQISMLQPTVCILSEFRNNESGLQLRYGLLRAGYQHQFVTQAQKDDNSVLIVSVLPCNSQLHPSSDPLYSQNILSVEFDIFKIMGVYLPHKKKHALFEYLLDHFKNSDKPYIIAGDFNSGINGIDQVGNSFWYEDQLKEMNKIGYIDAFRLLHGDAREYSWYSHQGNGFRYDHTYIHECLSPVIKECYYLSEWREQKYSDHAPMVLKLS